ncbi:MAG: bestrophin family ion channel, partial [Waterburya sp.]
MNILGSCERILKTPKPLALPILLKQLLILYCLSLPIEMVDALKWWTILIIIIIISILFGFDKIGSELGKFLIPYSLFLIPYSFCFYLNLLFITTVIFWSHL